MPFQRFAPVSASTRTLPLCTCDAAICVPTKNMSMRAGEHVGHRLRHALVLDEQRCRVPLIDFITSAGMWLAVPMPAEP